MHKRGFGWLPLALVCLLGRPFLGGEGEENRSLSALRSMPLGHGSVISAEYFPDGAIEIGGHEHRDLPPRMVLRILMRPAPRSNINVEIWLPAPEHWNGRLLGLGNGGAAGSINPGAFLWPIRAGYAVAATDMGTAPNDRSGVDNPEVWKDFGFRATHLMTVAAKRAVETYYGRAPDYSYFNGGSTGGQQALREAQRYPEDYDGIVADVPAHCRTPLHAYFLWNWQILRRCPLTPEQEAAVVNAGHEYMAGREPPQTAGRLVSDPRATEADREAVIALARRRDPTLTDEHAEALRRIFQGPRHAVTGEVIFPGVPFGAGIRNATGHLYPFAWAFGAGKRLEDIDFGDDIDAYTARLGPYLNADDTDLRAFAERGGKLIMASGSADSIVPYTATLDYYDRVIDRFGSVDAVRAFFRFYLIPGRDHGWSGPGVNNFPGLLDLVVNWRENGIAPEGLNGRRLERNRLVFQIPVHPYPTRAVHNAAEKTFAAEEGPRGGVARVAARFRPPPEE